MTVYIIGGGMGAEALLTEEARTKLLSSDIVLATDRIAKVVQGFVKKPVEVVKLSSMPSRIQTLSEAFQISIIVSGDTGLYSAREYLMRELPQCQFVLIPGISSLQYMAARLGKGYEKVRILSLHGRDSAFLGALSCEQEVFMLTGGKWKAREILRKTTEQGLGGLQVWAGENLSLPEERILSGTAEILAEEVFSDLTVLWFENENAARIEAPYRDSFFVRGKVPMTKEEVRWTAASLLGVQRTDVIWDIGAGTGSCSVELARLARDGAVYALDGKEEAMDLIQTNRKKAGLYHITPVLGKAPEALVFLPVPDAVLIGGASGCILETLKSAEERNPDVRCVVTAVTLETVEEARNAFLTLGWNMEIRRITAEREKALGRFTMLKAMHSVWIFARKKEEST